MEYIINSFLILMFILTCFLIASAVNSVIWVYNGIKSKNETEFFNRWINSVYYITAGTMIVYTFIPSFFTSFVFVIMIITYIQQIRILSSEEELENMLNIVLSKS